MRELSRGVAGYISFKASQDVYIRCKIALTLVEFESKDLLKWGCYKWYNRHGMDLPAYTTNHDITPGKECA